MSWAPGGEGVAKCTAGAATRFPANCRGLAAASLAAEVVVVEAEATIGWRAGKGLTDTVGGWKWAVSHHVGVTTVKDRVRVETDVFQ
jgi:hypothetical protein